MSFKTKICVSLRNDNINQVLDDMKNVAGVDLVEIRIDYIKNMDENKLSLLLNNKSLPVIITNRIESEGGKFTGSEEERISLLKKAMEMGADYIDIELSAGERAVTELIANKKKSRIICSWHNFKETPCYVGHIYERIKRLNPDIIKIASYASSINDNFTIMELSDKNSICLAMGIKGQISRILTPKFSSFLTYGARTEDTKSAPGQILVDDLRNIYNFHLLDENTKVLGVIGGHAENSLSKYMHNINFKEKNLNYIYVPFKTSEEELPVFMENFRKYNFHGAAVTIPHKVEIIKYLDGLHETAEKIGAVNTIVKKDGKLMGYNTDCQGAIDALRQKTSIENKYVLVLGAGGASRAICYGLKQNGAHVIISNRTGENAKKLADEFNLEYCDFQDIYKLDTDIIINTTSVGMYPHTECSIVKKEFLKSRVVFDIVYRPMATRLIKDGKEMGSIVVEGYEMLLYQGIEQYRLWTGTEPDVDLMKNILFERLQSE